MATACRKKFLTHYQRNAKKFEKIFCQFGKCAYLCSVEQKKLTYHNMHTNLCGTPSKSEGFCSTHTTPHRPYTDATDPSESSVRSFSIQVRNKTLLNLSFNQAKSLALLLFVRMYQNTNSRDAKDYPDEPILWDEINANNIHDRMVEKWKKEIKKIRIEITKTYKYEE